MQTSDGQRVEVYVPPGESLAVYKDHVQLIGKVRESGGVAIEVWKMHDAGDKFDMDAYNRAVGLSQDPKYRALFMQ